MISSQHRAAFTLIELSIVLVIIGLIVGGILVGRDLIDAARIRATISQVEKYKTAVNTFKLKYNGMPGDITQSQATAYGLLPASRPGDGGGTVIHGDEYIEDEQGMSYYAFALLSYEHLLFWQDLSSANLIDGSFSSATDGSPAGITYGTLTSYIPPARMDGAYWFVYSVGRNYSDPGIRAPVGNYYALIGISGINNDFAPSLNIGHRYGLSPIQAYSIDVKTDDGRPDTGRVMGSNIRGTGGELIPFYNGSPGCFNGYPTASGYNTTSTTPECDLSFAF